MSVKTILESLTIALDKMMSVYRSHRPGCRCMICEYFEGAYYYAINAFNRLTPNGHMSFDNTRIHVKCTCGETFHTWTDYVNHLEIPESLTIEEAITK